MGCDIDARMVEIAQVNAQEQVSQVIIPLLNGYRTCAHRD